MKNSLMKGIWYYIFDLKWESGLRISYAKKYLMNTHCAKYWGVVPRFDPLTNTVYVYMEGNERVTVYMETGTVIKENFDM